VRTYHRGEEDGGGEENMPLHVEGFMGKEILLNYLCGVKHRQGTVLKLFFKGDATYLTTYEKLQRERREHI
jgi:hypothetical protein